MLNQALKILKASTDPVFFAEDEFFLGQELYPKQAEVLREFYKDDYDELIVIAGFKSGKTFLASIFGCYEAFKLLIFDDPAKHYGLAPGSKIFIVGVAVSEDQARDTIFAQIASKVMASPFFRRHKPKIYKTEIRFDKGVVILCGTSSSASMVGRTVKCIIFDELARFEQSVSKRGAFMVYSSLSKQTAVFGKEGKKIVISSPLHASDIVMQLYERSKQLPNVLSFKYPTWEMNPNISFEDLRDELEKDPLSFWRDFGAEPTAAVSPYFGNLDIIPDETIPNVLSMLAEGLEVRPVSTNYILTGDPALRHDSFGLALGHREGDKFVVDGLYRFTPTKKHEIDPLEVKEFIKTVIRTLPVTACVFDTWNFPEAQEEIRRMGIPVHNHIVRKQDYDHLKNQFYQGKVILCNYPLVRQELSQLQLLSGTKVTEPKGGSKDVADALCNLIWALTHLKPLRSSTNLVEVI